MKIQRLFITALAICAVLNTPIFAGSLAKIYISPGYAGLASTATQQFKVYGVDDSGKDVPVTGQVTWSAQPGAGQISPSGLFTPTKSAGVFAECVAATVSGLSARAGVEIIAATPSAGYVFERSWGSKACGQFNDPCGIARDSEGNIYVADTGNHRIQKFDSSGNYVCQWGSYGVDNNRMHYPGEIAVSGDYLYVTRLAKPNVVKYDLTGQYISSLTLGEGSSSSISGLTTDSQGNIYVVQSESATIYKYDSKGTLITKFGSKGSGDGEFKQPGAIAVNSNGNICVADTGNSRVQLLNSSGDFIAKWGSNGCNDGQFQSIAGVAFDSQNGVVVVDSDSVQVFDPQGAFYAKFRVKTTPNANTFRGVGLVVDGQDNTYVLDAFSGSVHVLDPDGKLVATWSQSPLNGRLNAAKGLAVDKEGNTYVADTRNGRVQKFDADGAFVTTWGSFGNGQGLLMIPEDIAVDSAHSKVYLPYTGTPFGVQAFDLSGSFSGVWATSGGLGRLCVDSDGYVYSCVANEVHKYDSGGREVASMKTGASHPEAIAVDSSKNIYVSDIETEGVLKLNSSGKLLQTWGKLGHGAGEFLYPHGIAVAPDGSVFVADNNNNRVQKFDSSGKCVGEFGTYGGRANNLGSVQDIGFDAEGNLYLIDSMNGNVQKWAPTKTSAAPGRIDAPTI